MEILYDKLCSWGNLKRAYKRAFDKRSRPGPDGLSWQEVRKKPDKFVRELQDELMSCAYRIRRPAIEKKSYMCGTKNKEIIYNVLNIKERVIEYAIREILSPLYEEIFLPFSCAYRKGVKDSYFEQLVNQAIEDGYIYFLAVDIRSFFYSIDRNILLNDLLDFTKDEKLVTLISKCLFFDESETGIMPGHILSPFLSNIYLHPVDLRLREGYVIRYSDGIFFPQEDNLDWDKKIELVSRLLRERKLELNHDKTKLLLSPTINDLLLE